MPPIEYTLRPLDAARHLIEVSVRADSNRDWLDLRMPAWRPGRYVFQNFARLVQEFDAGGRPWERVDKDTWRIHGSGALEARYRCYANVLDGGGSLYDGRELYVNGISSFMAVDGRLDEPCTLRIDCPADWSLAAPLHVRDRVLVAKSFHELVDSPLIASPTIDTSGFDVLGLHCHVHIQGSGNYDMERIKHDLEKIVEQQLALFGRGSLPFSDYHFLYHLMPYRFSHGVEHAGCASMVIGPSDEFDTTALYDRFLSLSSHELFHVWNVKRFRPDALVPYDYWRARCTPLLYVAEGFTSYYGDLTLARTEQWSRSRYFQALADEVSKVRNAAGSHIRTLEDASWDVWNSGYGAAPPTSTVSFYSKGELVGLLLDIEIRRRTENRRSLDDVMRRLDVTFGDGRHGYTRDDFQGIAEEVVGKSGSLDGFFTRCARTTDELPIEETLEWCGLELIRTAEHDKPEARLGMAIEEQGMHNVIKTVHPDGPAAEAGVEPGDVLLTFDGRRASATRFPRLLAQARSGTRRRLTVLRHERQVDFDVMLADGVMAKFDIHPKESMTPAQRRFVDAWLAPVAFQQLSS